MMNLIEHSCFKFRASSAERRGAVALSMVLLILLFISMTGWIFSRGAVSEMQMTYRTADVIRAQLLVTGLATSCGIADIHEEYAAVAPPLDQVRGIMERLSDMMHDNSENAGHLNVSYRLDAADFDVREIVDDTHDMVTLKKVSWKAGVILRDKASNESYVLNGVLAKDYKILRYHVVGSNSATGGKAVLGWPSSVSAGTPANVMNSSNAGHHLSIVGHCSSGEKGAIHLAGTNVVIDLNDGTEDGIIGKLAFEKAANFKEGEDAEAEISDMHLIPGFGTIKDVTDANWTPYHNTAVPGTKYPSDSADGITEYPGVETPIECPDAETTTPTLAAQRNAVKDRIWYSGIDSGRTHLWGPLAKLPNFLYATGLKRRYREYALEFHRCPRDTCEILWCEGATWEMYETSDSPHEVNFLDEPHTPGGWSINNPDSAAVVGASSSSDDKIRAFAQKEYLLAATTYYPDGKRFTHYESASNPGQMIPEGFFSWGGLLYADGDLVVGSESSGNRSQHVFIYTTGDVKVERSLQSPGNCPATGDEYQAIIVAEGQLKQMDSSALNLDNTYLYFKRGLGTTVNNLNLSGNLIFGESSDMDTDRQRLGGKITYKEPVYVERHTIPHSNCGFFFSQ